MRAALLGLALLGLMRDPSCGGVDTPASGVNAPCTRDKDCQLGLVCASGVCEGTDAAAPIDGGGDEGSAQDASAEHD
jgi:hypothetical protein